MVDEHKRKARKGRLVERKGLKKEKMKYAALCAGVSFFIVTVSVWTLEEDVLFLSKRYGMSRTVRRLPDRKCISSVTDCDLSCLKWTLVLAMGRSGSTTVQQMISKLPGFHMYGEEGGLLGTFSALHKKIQTSPRGLPWWGSTDKNVTTVACLAQKFYSERHGDSCLHRGCRHGFKEIRYTSAEQIKWLETVFPSATFILNYRNLCSNYTDAFNRNCSILETQRDSFLKAAENLTRSFHMSTEQLTNLTAWSELATFLDFDGCTAHNVTSANLNRGYTEEESNENPWVC